MLTKCYLTGPHIKKIFQGKKWLFWSSSHHLPLDSLKGISSFQVLRDVILYDIYAYKKYHG